MALLKKLRFCKKVNNRKTGVVRGILLCLVPCIRKQKRSQSPERKRNTQERTTTEHYKETTHGCIGAQYEALMLAERRQELLEIRKPALRKENAWRWKQPKELSHSAQLDSNSFEESEEGHQTEEEYQEFEFLQYLGGGGFGQVVLATRKSKGGHKSSREFFAVKIVPKGHVSVVEKEVLIRAVGHPFLVQLFSYFQTKDSVFYVMEFMEGGSLYSLLCDMRRLPEHVARFYSAEIILAVSFLHKCGIVHRDIKPGNVLLDRDGHCKLADFGLCEVGIFNGKLMSTSSGTRRYAAPEVVHSYQYGPEVDWWSVGRVMYDMMMGLYPCEVFLHPLRYPTYLTQDAASILRMFLTRNPRYRLGVRGNTRSIRMHPFFKKVDWEAVLQKRVEPPYKPQIIKVMTVGPEARGTADDGGRNPSCGTMDVGVVVEGPPIEPQSVKCSTMDPGPRDDADEGRSNKSLKIVNEGVVLEGPPIEPRSVKCAAMDPVAGGDDDGQIIPSIETTNCEAMLEQPPLKQQTVKCPTMDAGASVNADEGQSNSSFKTVIQGPVLEGPTVQHKSVNGGVLVFGVIFCIWLLAFFFGSEVICSFLLRLTE